MKRLSQLIALIVLAAGAFASSAAFAHPALKQAEPAPGETVAAPKEIVLHFNEKLAGAFSTVALSDTTGKPVDAVKGMVDPDDATVLKAELSALPPGGYQVKWKAVGPDGHVRKGDYTFTVK